MAKKTKLNKISKLIQKDTNYFIHIFESNKDLDNFEFIDLETFFKKHKKNESCNDILISDLLEYFSEADSLEVLSGILSKMKKGSRLYVQGTDILSVCSSLINNQITPSMFNMIVYGLGKKHMFTFGNIKSLLSGQNLQINQIKFINGINYYIECTKL
jgi:hypothetical protein